MLGLMMDQPLLISSMIEHAAKFYGDVDIVSRGTDGIVVRSSWGEVARRLEMVQAQVTPRPAGVVVGPRGRPGAQRVPGPPAGQCAAWKRLPRM